MIAQQIAVLQLVLGAVQCVGEAGAEWLQDEFHFAGGQPTQTSTASTAN